MNSKKVETRLKKMADNYSHSDKNVPKAVDFKGIDSIKLYYDSTTPEKTYQEEMDLMSKAIFGILS